MQRDFWREEKSDCGAVGKHAVERCVTFVTSLLCCFAALQSRAQSETLHQSWSHAHFVPKWQPGKTRRRSDWSPAACRFVLLLPAWLTSGNGAILRLGNGREDPSPRNLTSPLCRALRFRNDRAGSQQEKAVTSSLGRAISGGNDGVHPEARALQVGARPLVINMRLPRRRVTDMTTQSVWRVIGLRSQQSRKSYCPASQSTQPSATHQAPAAAWGKGCRKCGGRGRVGRDYRILGCVRGGGLRFLGRVGDRRRQGVAAGLAAVQACPLSSLQGSSPPFFVGAPAARSSMAMCVRFAHVAKVRPAREAGRPPRWSANLPNQNAGLTGSGSYRPIPCLDNAHSSSCWS